MNRKKITTIAAGIFVFVVGLWLAWLLWIANPVARIVASKNAPDTAGTVSISSEVLGQAGDMFGGLNTLFAGLAFAFVALAAYIQRLTLDSQNAQLKAAREQQKLAEFEPLFFQLLALFRSLHSEARLEYVGVSSKFGLDHPNFRLCLEEIATVAIDGSGVKPDASKRLTADMYGSRGAPKDALCQHCTRLVECRLSAAAAAAAAAADDQLRLKARAWICAIC
ncbi:hypothetical protein QTH89_04725 [Variovorax sp. J22G21]|uniref:hypothetical protein n=1 Tax=Variovorax fucosicus TaxID=3053517 RepID=UPI0025769007|nr:MULTISPECIES: hypothetical protein [unclassified Variovorax]MDM0041451.1 hypothetical protein [Variovorax sp. J22R193]MDM0060507.1 hypothetical protein [Variovorax sp. J22G21]